MKKAFLSSARGASFRTKQASNVNVVRVVLFDANSYLAYRLFDVCQLMKWRRYILIDRVNSTSHYTVWTLYRTYFKGISANIELQVIAWRAIDRTIQSKKQKRCPRSRHTWLSINRPTKRGKEKSPSNGHCQCEKEMDGIYWRVNKFLKESHKVTRLAKERASFLTLMTLTSHFLERLTVIMLCYSVSGNANSIGRIKMKCQNWPVMPPAQVFYFNSLALLIDVITRSIWGTLLNNY
jgi:hypothetical protein